MFTIKDLTTAENFIKDAVIDKVLKDLGLKLMDLASFDKHAIECFEILCIAKHNHIMEEV